VLLLQVVRAGEAVRSPPPTITTSVGPLEGRAAGRHILFLLNISSTRGFLRKVHFQRIQRGQAHRPSTQVHGGVLDDGPHVLADGPAECEQEAVVGPRAISAPAWRAIEDGSQSGHGASPGGRRVGGAEARETPRARKRADEASSPRTRCRRRRRFGALRDALARLPAGEARSPIISRAVGGQRTPPRARRGGSRCRARVPRRSLIPGPLQLELPEVRDVHPAGRAAARRGTRARSARRPQRRSSRRAARTAPRPPVPGVPIGLRATASPLACADRNSRPHERSTLAVGVVETAWSEPVPAWCGPSSEIVICAPSFARAAGTQAIPITRSSTGE